jgi:hypothetical protein
LNLLLLRRGGATGSIENTGHFGVHGQGLPVPWRIVIRPLVIEATRNHFAALDLGNVRICRWF